MRASYLLLLTGCAEPDLVRILDSAGRGWDLVDAPRGDLIDLDTVSGPAARFWVGSELDPTAMHPALDCDEAGDVLGGHEPSAQWTLIGGTAVPDDYDTLALFTAFAHTERALDHFARSGVVGRAVSPVDVHYLPELLGSGLSMSDNAYYFLPADAILLLEPVKLQDVPLAMNPGVIAHELSHRVSYWQFWDGRKLRVYADEDAGTFTHVEAMESLYLLAALDEGMADYFGAVISGDPAFVGQSVGFLQVSRDVSVQRVYDPDWVGTLEPYWTEGAYDPYQIGSVVASALWAAGDELGHDRVSEALVAAQRELSERALGLDILHTDLEVEVVRQLGPDACPAFFATYFELWEAFSEVCA